jgi:hypothetical protein
VQVVPSTQAPLPVHPEPPHCEYFVRLPAGAGGAAEALATALCVEVTSVVAATEEGAALLLPAAAPPGPATDVVRDPDSMYTPLK